MRQSELEQLVWEKTGESANDLLDELSLENRDLVHHYFGIFPFRPHSIRQLAEYLDISPNMAHKKIKKVLIILKEIIKNRP